MYTGDRFTSEDTDAFARNAVQHQVQQHCEFEYLQDWPVRGWTSAVVMVSLELARSQLA